MTFEQRGSGMGLHEHVGAALYEQDGETLVTLLSPEEEAVQFLLDGLGVASIAELKQLVDTGRGDARVACWFTPQSIRDHFDIGGGGELDEWVASADEYALRRVGEDAISDDRLWQTFHEILVDAIRERL